MSDVTAKHFDRNRPAQASIAGPIYLPLYSPAPSREPISYGPSCDPD